MSDLDLLVGRKVVGVRRATTDYDGTETEWGWGSGILLLDNGVEVVVRPNEGGCACSSGDYFLTRIVDSIDNVITSVEEVVTEHDKFGDAKTYEVFVVAAEKRVNLFAIEGDDGNGYYGTGYSVHVREVSDDA